LRCAASFVIAAYFYVRLIPQNLRALHLELFSLPSDSPTFHKIIILGEAKEEQFPLLEPTGRVWKLPEASLRMVKKSFQRAKGNLSNRPSSIYL
jgi:hypothetical protein